MEGVQHRWRLRWSFKNATIVVTLFNVIASLFLLHSFFSSSSSTKPSSVERYIKEAEEVRRAMLPVELILRVKEIQKEAYVQPDLVQQKDAKQTVAVDLISRLNNYRSYSDSGTVKAKPGVFRKQPLYLYEYWRNGVSERWKELGSVNLKRTEPPPSDIEKSFEDLLDKG